MSYNYSLSHFAQVSKATAQVARGLDGVGRFNSDNLNRSFDLRRFNILTEEWRHDTLLSSSIAEISDHPAYRAIIRMGWGALGAILRDLERRPDHWFVALEAITGESPVADQDRGRMKKMSEAWLAWGRANRLI